MKKILLALVLAAFSMSAFASHHGKAKHHGKHHSQNKQPSKATKKAK